MSRILIVAQPFFSQRTLFIQDPIYASVSH